MTHQRGLSSSLLELEAADYFKLDLDQVKLFRHQPVREIKTKAKKPQQTGRLDQANSVGPSFKLDENTMKKSGQPSSKTMKKDMKHEDDDRMLITKVRPKSRLGNGAMNPPQLPVSRLNNTSISQHQPQSRPILATSTQFAGSSTTSTNSLPSISSSPSVSPSLLCPHTSLDDILALRYGSAKSPHTIGLCAKCRLDPPPNVHSPLSPVFRPTTEGTRIYKSRITGPKQHPKARRSATNLSQASSSKERPMDKLRRGYSDHHVGAYERGRGLSGQREDSLDYFLQPDEIRRLQMSPTLRNSVEFIRNNSIEPGRILRIYKNGQPFDKPLRICITRGEFATLNHLLDYINSRQLIACGARYLFHMDGQLAYSVNELKHGSTYIVSGTRNFDYRSNGIIKEQQKADQQRQHQHQQHQMMMNHISDESDLKIACRLQQQCNQPQAINTLRSLQTTTIDPAKSSSSNVSYKQQEQGANPEPLGRNTELHGSTESLAKRRQPKTAKIGLSKHNKDLGTMSTIGKSATGKVSPRKALTKGTARNDQGNVSPKCNSLDRELDPTSKSSENLRFSSKNEGESDRQPQERIVKVARAKSDLTAVPNKRKKYVTFVDTGRGSSPAISDLSSSETTKTSSIRHNDDLEESRQIGNADVQLAKPSEPDMGMFTRNEVGIQVSDSIDGFLIDLPLPLPATGDDANLNQPTSSSVKSRSWQVGTSTSSSSTMRQTRLSQQQSGSVKGANKRFMGRGAVATASNGRQPQSGAKQEPKKVKRQIVTITERQLSLEEMSKLKELGAHHSELRDHPQVTIKLDHVADRLNSDEEDQIVPDRSNTITIGADPDKTPSGENRSEKPNLTVASGEQASGDEPTEAHWQYPGGRESSATPTERPVSQSDANESVRARVTTPTPSLSTTDNNSLTVSYETSSAIGPQHPSSHRLTSGSPKVLPNKKQVEVSGKLYAGLNEPRSNFRLTWVNGFNINDQYPDNSITMQQIVSESTQQGSRSPQGASSPTLDRPGGVMLSPSIVGHHQPHHHLKGSNPIQFKPSDRFSNWICYSPKHNELLYPAGCFVVMWCKWTDEQRYYAKHTTNVSSVALASLDFDLVASAQVMDTSVRPQTNASIHLWSLTSLDTLLILDNDLFRHQRIFSLRLKNSSASGCELTVGARDDKRLWLYMIHPKLNTDIGSTETAPTQSQASTSKQSTPSKAPVERPTNVIETNKTIQSNQTPLLILPLANLQEASSLPTSNAPVKQPPVTGSELLLCFGQRHFNVWSIDKKQSKLRPLQPEHKSAKFVELIVKANCLLRMAPNEFVVGDSSGSISMMILKYRQRTPVRTVQADLAKGLTYDIEVVHLLGPSEMISVPQDPDQSASKRLPSVTSLMRITGSLFASGDSNCTIRFWKIQRPSSSAKKQQTNNEKISCTQLSCINLPDDLGFICTILLANYDRKQSMVDFYVISTSNAILFGSVQLKSASTQSSSSSDILTNSSLSVVYEGHETSASSLVADSATANDETGAGGFYFTCSFDCKICKWRGKRLVWKSVLPSSCASIAVHPIGFVLAVGSADGTVYILDKISGLLISYFPLTPVRINCLAYSMDGALLAAGCANGSIFILPVYERGLKYKKVSIFQSPHAVVSLQFSENNRYILTSVTHGSYQELILWDLPNFRYMRDNVKLRANKIKWFDSICSGSEDVRAIWENTNLFNEQQASSHVFPGRQVATKKSSTSSINDITPTATIVNLSCHRLIRSDREDDRSTPTGEDFVVASDTRGFVRLFSYPCHDIQQGFYAIRASSTAVNCCRFLKGSDQVEPSNQPPRDQFVSSSLDGTICLWRLE